MNDLIKIDPEGKITARDFYIFLQLDLSNYSKWCKNNIVENEFAEENVDWGILVLDDEYFGRGQRAANYWLSIAFAKKLCMLSKSERGEQARNYFIEIENRYTKQVVTTDPLDLIILQATMMKELRQKQEAQELAQIEQAEEIKQLAAKMETSPKEYFTIAGYLSLRGIRLDLSRAVLLGRKAAFLSKEYDYAIGKTHDPRFGQVNTYHSDILAEVFKKNS